MSIPFDSKEDNSVLPNFILIKRTRVKKSLVS